MSGSVTHRRRTVRLQLLTETGSTMSPDLILTSSSSRLRGASPRPLRRIQPDSVFHIAYAKKQTKMCALTRSSLWCQIGRRTSSSLAMRKAHSASVN